MRKIESGMITVETAMVLPIVFFVLVLLLYFFFFCYESGVAAGILREEVIKISDTIKTSGDIETGDYNIDSLNGRKLSYLLNYDSGKLESNCKSNIKEKLARQSIFGSNWNINIEVKHGIIIGHITSEIKIPLLGSVEVGKVSLFQVEEQIKERVSMPAEQIRRWQQIE
jgi:hypothetical protein